MRTATVREFRDQATKLFKETEPILVTRRGRIVGFYLPATGTSLPLEIRKWKPIPRLLLAKARMTDPLWATALTPPFRRVGEIGAL